MKKKKKVSEERNFFFYVCLGGNGELLVEFEGNSK